MPNYEFTYRSILRSETQMLMDLINVLEENQVVGAVKHGLMVAVSEAFTNALIHGNRLDPEKEIKLVITINKSEICADIIDQGTGALDRIKNKRPSTLLAENGRGLDLIRHYASSMTLQEVAKGGLKISVKFSRDEKCELNKCK